MSFFIHLDNLKSKLLIFIVTPDVRLLHGSQVAILLLLLFFDLFFFSPLSFQQHITRKLQQCILGPDNKKKKKNQSQDIVIFLIPFNNIHGKD